MRYIVTADDTRYSETFTCYAEAYCWLRLVRVTFGCNAGLTEVKS